MSDVVQQINEVGAYFGWFLSLSNLFGLPLNYLTPLLLIIPFLFKNDHFKNLSKDFDKKYPIVLLPAFWIVICFFGAIFRADGPYNQFSKQILNINIIILLAFFIYSLILIVRNKGYRTLSIILVLVNSFFVLWLWFISGMAIDGHWL
jgi:hypothetical protein